MILEIPDHMHLLHDVI
jgi:hypothetical protein